MSQNSKIDYKISVVTVAYNCEAEIEETIKSVLAQTYENVEYLIIDGASKDRTMDIVNKYKNSIDFISSEPDKGIYDAMNKGIIHASGDFIIFMNAGDSFYEPDSLKKIVRKIESDSTVVYGNIMKVAKQYKYLAKPSPVEQMTSHMTVFHQATLMNLAYHKQNLFDTTFRSSGDYNFFYNAALRDRVKFQYVQEIFANFECVDGTSNSNFKRSIHENLRIWGKENDFLFKLKLECHLNLMALKIWIKKHLMTKNQILFFEKRRLTRQGFTLIEK